MRGERNGRSTSIERRCIDDEVFVKKPVELYSCFLSYSSRDDAFARRLYNDLQGKNIRTWFAPEDLQIGNFRQWKAHDDYTKSFERLVRDLKKAQPAIVMR